MHLVYENQDIIMTFLIIIGALLVTTFLILHFSCNDPETNSPEDE